MKIDLEHFPESPSAKRMMSRITQGFYDRSYVGKWIFEVMGRELDSTQQYMDELPLQAFVETATWGLRYFEEKYGLPVREKLSYEERRRYILERRDMRAPMNPWRMEKILSSTTGREVSVEDMADDLLPNTFRVTIYPGESIVDYKAAYETLDRIKQSHTTYVMDMRAETAQSVYAGLAYFSHPVWSIYDEGLHRVDSEVYVGCAVLPTSKMIMDDRG